MCVTGAIYTVGGDILNEVISNCARNRVQLYTYIKEYLFCLLISKRFLKLASAGNSLINPARSEAPHKRIKLSTPISEHDPTQQGNTAINLQLGVVVLLTCLL